MANEAGKSVFAKRQKQHVLILASGNKVRHLTLKPWMTALGISFASAITIGYFAATSYLVLRDDLLGASLARQARMQHEYEDRISALRAQVDRVTSRQLLDQQVVEKKVEKLMEQQMALTDRHGRIDELLERADGQGSAVPVPTENPRKVTGKQASLSGSPFDAVLRTEDEVAAADPATQALGFAPVARSPASSAQIPGASSSGSSVDKADKADKADKLFGKVTKSLKSIEQQQFTRINALRAGAEQKADAIAEILQENGITPKGAEDDGGTGGPYIPVSAVQDDRFDLSLNSLDLALQRLDDVRTQAEQYPFGNPLPGAFETSGYGYRKDPFFGTLAFHPGVDFRSVTGTPARATAPGTVVTAGPAGGYGNMVEIDHGNGVSTRYGHLSAILVSKGQHVDTNEVIGKVGSTGRSTGPHLHYEIRRNGQAMNPIGFLKSGVELASLLEIRR